MEKTTGVERGAVHKPDSKGDRRLSRLLLMTLLSAGYLLPTAIALHRRHMTRFDTAALVLLNIIGGWTIVGWCYTLYIARRAEDAPVQAIPPKGRAVSPAQKATLRYPRKGAPLGVRPRSFATYCDTVGLLPAQRGDYSSAIRYGPNRYARLTPAQRLLAERQVYSPASRARRHESVDGGWSRYLRERVGAPPTTGLSSWAQRIAEEDAEYARNRHGGSRHQSTRGTNRAPPRQRGRRATEWNSTGLSRMERFAML